MGVCVSINVLIISSLDVNSFCKKEMFSCRNSSAFFSLLEIVLRRSNNDPILLLILENSLTCASTFQLFCDKSDLFVVPLEFGVLILIHSL